MVFVETDAGVVIKPAEVLVSDALDEIDRALEAKGIDLEQLLERGRECSGEMIEKEYGLDDRPTSFGKVQMIGSKVGNKISLTWNRKSSPFCRSNSPQPSDS